MIQSSLRAEIAVRKNGKVNGVATGELEGYGCEWLFALFFLHPACCCIDFRQRLLTAADNENGACIYVSFAYVLRCNVYNRCLDYRR